MGKRKTVVFIMTGLLIVLAAFIEFVRVEWRDFPLSVVLTSEGGREQLECWKKAEHTYYIFLPSYADPAQARLDTARFSNVTLQGQPVGGDTTCAGFPLNEPLRLKYTSFGISCEDTLIITQSGGVPALYVDVVSGSMDYIHETKGNAEAGSLRLYTQEGALDCSAQIRAINGRGNTSWDAPKKSYSVELTEQKDVLGMGAAKKWILIANWYDTTNFCSKMVFDFAAAAGAAYTPECRWTDLYLNGQYAGLYLLCERNEFDPQRIAVDESRSFLLSLSVDWQLDTSRPWFASQRDNLLRIHQAGMSEDEIRDIWQCVEDAVYEEDGINPYTGQHWTELIDLDSWAEQFLLDEVFVEFDACALSQYFYYDPDSGKVCAGPIWDTDNILNRSGKHPANILASARPYVWDRDNVPLFWVLYQKEEFRQRVVQLYEEVYRPGLLALAQGGIEDYARQCQAATVPDRIRWGKVSPYPEVKRLSRYLEERIAFLDAYWGHEEEFCVLDVLADQQWRRFAVRRGETAEFLLVYTEKYGDVRWTDYDSEELYDLSEPVTRDRSLRMWWPGTWTGLSPENTG